MGHKTLESGLKKLKKAQTKGDVFQSKIFSDNELSQLKKNGFVREIIRGWYHSGSPSESDYETTAWYASFWEFTAKYLKDKFKKNYCLSSEVSLSLHTGDTVVPKQITAVIKSGSSYTLDLPHGISLLVYPDKKNFPEYTDEMKELRVQSLEYALCKAAPHYWQYHQKEIEIALSQIKNLTTLMEVLTKQERMDTAAGRMVGAFRFVNREADAKTIKETYEIASGKTLQVINPFSPERKCLVLSRDKHSSALRIEAMWHGWREKVHEIGKSLPRGTPNVDDIEEEMEHKRVLDAYHSLSIEGYRITDELIERVSKGSWDPEESKEDANSRDALAARGYYEAFSNVKYTIIDVIQNSKKMSKEIEGAQQEWYRALFAPSVRAGIFEAYELAGYRNDQVYLRGSNHVPLAKEELMDAMEVCFELLNKETDPFVCAVLGHHLLGFIHPYMDGNGRIARFVMNAFLTTGGYPWVIIDVGLRKQYMAALEKASVNGDIESFAMFVAEAARKGW